MAVEYGQPRMTAVDSQRVDDSQPTLGTNLSRICLESVSTLAAFTTSLPGAAISYALANAYPHFDRFIGPLFWPDLLAGDSSRQAADPQLPDVRIPRQRAELGNRAGHGRHGYVGGSTLLVSDGDSWQSIKTPNFIPVLMLSGRTTRWDTVLGIERGAWLLQLAPAT